MMDSLQSKRLCKEGHKKASEVPGEPKCQASF